MKLHEYLSQEPGRGAKLARDSGNPQPSISGWSTGKVPCPTHRRPGIEQHTEGAVPCEEWGADVIWCRVPDPTWPWHPDGRPTIDVTRGAGRPMSEAA